MLTGALPRDRVARASSLVSAGQAGVPGESLLSRSFTVLTSVALVIVLYMAATMEPIAGPRPTAMPAEQLVEAAPSPVLLAPSYRPRPSIDAAQRQTSSIASSPAAAVTPLDPKWEWARNATIVFTWVNGSDPEYCKLRQEYGGAYAIGGDRDRDNDDLKFSLLTLAKHMPWHTGRIGIVSPSPPSFIRLAHPPIDASGKRVPHPSPAAQTGRADPLGRIEWIDQNALLPKEAQPTFSSNVVEAFLHKLPPPPVGSHLPDSEWIIHCNDDYTFPSLLHPSDFFTLGAGPEASYGNVWINEDNHRGRGASRGVLQFLEPQAIRKRLDYDDMIPSQNIWLFSTYHTVDVIENAYGPIDQLAFPPHYVKHAPFVYSRTGLEGTARRFQAEVNKTLSHRCRHYNDVITPLLVHAYTAMEGSVPGARSHDQPMPLTFAVVPNEVIMPATLLQKWTSHPETNAAVRLSVRHRIARGLKFLAMNDEMGTGLEARKASADLRRLYRELYGDKKSHFEL